jgi:hypothetical protein
VINLSVITTWAFNLADHDTQSDPSKARRSDIVTFGSRPVRSRRPDFTGFGDLELGGGILVTTVLETDRGFHSSEDYSVKAVNLTAIQESVDINESKGVHEAS